MNFKFLIKEETMITFEQARKLYDNYCISNKLRLEKLLNYYDGKHSILYKPNRSNGQAPSKIMNNYPKYISTMATGYFIGSPITYVYQAEQMKELEKIHRYNYESSHNAELALDMSIFGVAYELIYLDEASKYCFASVDPRNVLTLDDGKIKPTITDAVIFDEQELADNKVRVIMEVYDSSQVATYEYIKDTCTPKDFSYKLLKTETHNIGHCPVIEYRNNKFKKGDFEDVISLVDAYNDATSTSLDDLKDFTDALLKLKNLSGTDEDDIAKIKDDKVILVDGDGDADWLVKTINDTYAQNIKDRIKHDIHKFSFTPDLTDTEFSGNLSGVAIKFKFQSLEQLRQEKERWFRKGLAKRLNMINTYMKRYGASIDPLDIEIKFSSNLPINDSEIASTMAALSGIVSKHTQLSQLPFVQDVELEIKQLKKEAKENPSEASQIDREVQVEDDNKKSEPNNQE